MALRRARAQRQQVDAGGGQAASQTTGRREVEFSDRGGTSEECRSRDAYLGMTALLGCRDRTRGETAAAELVAEGLDVAPTALDITQVKSAEAVGDHIRKTYGTVGCLVYKTGI